MIERRTSSRDRRAAARVPLVAAVEQRSGGATQLAQAANIGRLGMTLRYAPIAGRPPCPPRAKVTLAFQLPGGDEVIRVRGEVVFDRPEGSYRCAGVRFAAVRARHACEIARFVERETLH
jgi:hypothetical protein